MRLPRIQGEIERRLLVSYRVDPDALTRLLPPRFRPQLVDGAGVAGICLLRLGSVRPAWAPAVASLPSSENAAHRIAVEWDTADGPRTGVWIPRRDTASRLTVAVGGRLFPGEHHRARFRVQEDETDLHVAFASLDGSASVDVHVQVRPELEGSRLFADTAAASTFFETGSIGFSDTRDPGRWDGLELGTTAWAVDPGRVVHARSSFFDDAARFPAGSAELDCALVMRRVPVQWRALPSLTAA